VRKLEKRRFSPHRKTDPLLTVTISSETPVSCTNFWIKRQHRLSLQGLVDERYMAKEERLKSCVDSGSRCALRLLIFGYVLFQLLAIGIIRSLLQKLFVLDRRFILHAHRVVKSGQT
jgi:hypothetical protein